MSEMNSFGDEEIYGEVIPGYYLVHLVNCVQENATYKEGCWGLINDPEVVFHPDVIFYKDPVLVAFYPTMTDPQFSKELSRVEKVTQHYYERLRVPAVTGHDLVEACKLAGYNQSARGLEYWLSNRMATFLIENPKPVRIYPHPSKLEG